MLNIALPKGRLGSHVYKLFASIGYCCGESIEKSRKLVIECPDGAVRYFLVKPSDVAIYVERGVADIGVVGKDILAETSPDVYELLDLNLGKCRMAVCAENGSIQDKSTVLRVATKFVNITKKHYSSKNRDIEIIRLNGSIELAPLLGLSDVIVDIVETGTTLRENNLDITEEIMPISARLIANKARYKFHCSEVDNITGKLREMILNDTNI